MNDDTGWTFVKTILRFGILGPFVGLAEFIATLQLPLHTFPVLKIAYILGGPVALTAGFLATCGTIFPKRQPFWIGPLGGLLSLKMSHLLGFLPGAKSKSDLGLLALLIFSHFLAATVCWMVVRRTCR